MQDQPVSRWSEGGHRRAGLRPRGAATILGPFHEVFPGRAEREGLGTVHGDDQGFLAHVTLTVAPDRTPLGLLGIETWKRARAEGRSGPVVTSQ